MKSTMLNQIFLMGRLTRDPEIRQTQSGIPVAGFSLAVDHDYTNKDTGERGVDFIDCTAWRGTAEFIQKFFRKGSMAVVVGRLSIRNWTDSDGAKRRSAVVTVDRIYFGEGKRRAEDSNDAESYNAPLPGDDYVLIDDDVPLPFA